MEGVINLGRDSSISVDALDRGVPPVIEIAGAGGAWELLIYPQSWADEGEPSQEDADRASALVIAAAQFRNAIVERLMSNQDKLAARVTRRGREAAAKQ